MDIVALLNGLGNQMSQYAFYLAKKRTYGDNIAFICLNNDHNGIELDSVFGINCQSGLKKLFYFQILRILSTSKITSIIILLRKFLFLFGVSLIKENYDYKIQSIPFSRPPKGLRFLVGGWHNPNYYTGIEPIIRKTFAFKEIDDEKNLDILASITKHNSVCIHIRRGDYLKGDNYKLFGQVCDDHYYYKAMEYIEGKLGEVRYFVFSNDIEYSKYLMKNKHASFINWNVKFDSWKDMALMSKCPNLIIANSTFSWWSAWLNDNPQNIVCPKYFVYGDDESDIYLKEWHKIN